MDETQEQPKKGPGRGNSDYDASGENNANAKLSWEQIEEIRGAAKTVKSKELAEKYGVTAIHIWRIRTGRQWKGVG